MSGHEVEACNAVINNLFYEQFGENGGEFIRLLSKVVGEMTVELFWQGVAIEVELPVPRVTTGNAARRETLEGLAERLGL